MKVPISYASQPPEGLIKKSKHLIKNDYKWLIVLYNSAAVLTPLYHAICWLSSCKIPMRHKAIDYATFEQ